MGAIFAMFLSKGCASSTVLHKIIIEPILLLEKSDFKVDVIATDDATCNCSMWSKFGISNENISCEHIYDESRRLWFVTDFPHLVKNMQNCIVKQDEFWVSICICILFYTVHCRVLSVYNFYKNNNYRIILNTGINCLLYYIIIRSITFLV